MVHHSSQKKRADVLVVQQNLADSREKAQALILAGQILTGDRLILKPGEKLDAKTVLRVRGNIDSYVSRGAHKLIAALKSFRIDLNQKTCMDVGASTGGFTQVCLEHGAKKVFAVDVGHNQLHWKIRNDPRVISFEGVNIRIENQPDLEIVRTEKVQFACIDTSFISLKLVLPSVIVYLDSQASVVALIKPQHEVGKENVGKGGIVRDPKLHDQVTKEITEFAQKLGFEVKGLIESPIKGTTGNTEFLIHLLRQ